MAAQAFEPCPELGPWKASRCHEGSPGLAWSLVSCPRCRVACRYEQAGTPSLHVSTHYDPSARTFTIKTKQQTPDTPGQKGKRPVMLPLALGLLSKDGHEMPLHLKVLCLSSDRFQPDIVPIPVGAQGRCQAAAECGGPLRK